MLEENKWVITLMFQCDMKILFFSHPSRQPLARFLVLMSFPDCIYLCCFVSLSTSAMQFCHANYSSAPKAICVKPG